MSNCIFILFKLLGKIRETQMEESPQVSRNWNVVKSWQSQFSLSSIQGDVLKSPTVLRITQTLFEQLVDFWSLNFKKKKKAVGKKVRKTSQMIQNRMCAGILRERGGLSQRRKGEVSEFLSSNTQGLWGFFGEENNSSAILYDH